MGMEEVGIEFVDEATEAIINARRPSLTDFFRELFNRIDEQKTGFGYALHRIFKIYAILAFNDLIKQDISPCRKLGL
ncbi:hypothetical protein [Photorhabdus khanii]|uniref:hypothetical protein n=1 Tax=Photorhabdus khanii TaxID=1004150 RepID=UPI001864C5FA|nr:hypothetical protein [Photorhabdus khanii]